MNSRVVNPRTEKRIEYFARFGIFAKGVVYCLAGILTAMAAFGLRGAKSDQADTLKFIQNQPLGTVLLLIIAVGLAGYATWRLFQAFRDTEHKGSDAKGKFTRIGYGISAIVYLALAFYAVKMIVNGGSSGGQSSQKFIVSEILTYPFGQWVVGIIAAIIFFNGLRQIYKAISGSFMKNVNISGKHAESFRKTGIAGFIARGLVLLIVGYFFFRAALNANENEVEGTKGAFTFIENNYGSLLLGIVALGLLCYGIFMFVKARYQKIDLNF